MPKLLKPSRRFAIFLMLVNTFAWGAALPIVKPALYHITPYQFLLYRYIFAAIFSFPLLLYYIPKVKHLWKSIGVIILLELVGTTLALSMLYTGLSRTTAIQASLLAASTPIFVILGGIVFLRERQEKREWLGLFLTVLGTLILIMEPMIRGNDALGPISWLGNLLVIGHNLATTAYLILAKKFYIGIPKLFVTTISYYVGMLSFLIVDMYTLHGQAAGMTDPMFIQLSERSVLLAILYMSTFGSIIGLTAYMKGQEGMEASEASLFTYLQPLVFIPIGILFLKESLSPLMIFSICLIFGGVFVAEYRKKTSKPQSSSSSS